jgi:formylglycine-generating enzyme required for sulfatase activity
VRRSFAVAFAIAAVAATLHAQQDWPAEASRTVLPDKVVRFDRPAPGQSSYWWNLFIAYLTLKPAGKPPLGRSIAFLAGVSAYESLTPNRLDYVENDLTDLRNFLLTKGGFDTVYEARNGIVNRDLIDKYMSNEFTARGGLLTTDDRLLFYFSGHGTDQQGQVGYIQFSRARNGTFGGNDTLRVRDFQEMATVIAAKHLLVMLDSCASGLAISAKGEETEGLLKSLSGQGSGYILTAGYGTQKVFGVEGARGNSVMTRAFINALQNAGSNAGEAGLMTIHQVFGRVQADVGRFATAQGKKVSPQLGDLPRGAETTTDGTFVFLNPNARNVTVPPQYSGVLTSAKGGGGDSSAARYDLARLAFDQVKDSRNPVLLRAFVEDYQDVPGVATLVAVVREKIAEVERVPSPPTSRQPVAGEAKVNSRGDGLTYVWIPPGSFRMGCSEQPKDSQCDQTDELPTHDVTISKGFWMGQTDVTVAAYEKYRAANPSAALLPVTDNLSRKINTGGDDRQKPAVAVTWDEANAYCSWAGGRNLRLPTEAEWEYAARAGSPTSRYGDLNAIAWYGDNSGKPINSTQIWEDVKHDNAKYGQRLFENGNGPHKVGTLKANAWNLFDMLGNVWQWTADWYDAGYYKNSPRVDPPGPTEPKQYRALRGGSWGSNPDFVRVSFRDWYEPTARGNLIGFRCAGELP